MPFASVSFVGASGTGLNAHDANWISHTSYSTGSLVLSNANRCRRTTANNNISCFYYNVAPATADYSVTTDLFMKNADGGNGSTGPAGRIDTAANTMYYGRYNGSATDAWQLVKLVAGVTTQLGSNVTQTLTDETAYECKLQMVGAAIELYKEGSGTPTISVTDSAISAAGFGGLRSGGGSADSDTSNIHYVNFIGDDIGGGDVSVALTGSSATASAGTLGPEHGVSLSGAASTTAAGAVAPTTTVAASGAEATAAAGTVTVSSESDVTVALSGAAATAAAGSLALVVSVATVGEAATASAGMLAAQLGVALGGVEAASAAGTLTLGIGIGLSGQAVVAAAGYTTASGGDVVTAAAPAGGGNGWPRRVTYDQDERRLRELLQDEEEDFIMLIAALVSSGVLHA